MSTETSLLERVKDYLREADFTEDRVTEVVEFDEGTVEIVYHTEELYGGSDDYRRQEIWYENILDSFTVIEGK